MHIVRLVFLALTIALTATEAQAAPVATAIAAIAKAISLFAASSWIGSAIVGLATSAVTGLLNKALSSLLNKQRSDPVGIVLETQMGDDIPLSFVVGRRATAGKLKYWGTWGSEGKTPNAYYTSVYEIGALPSFAGPRGLANFWVGETKATILWDEMHGDGRGAPIAEFRKNGTDHAWVKYLDGTQTNVDDFLFSRFSGTVGRPWRSTMIGRGKQIVVLTLRYNTDLFTGSTAILAEPAPLRCYDLRKDTSIGGSGPHRWDNPATWEATTNNAVIIYNIVRGIQDQHGQWVYGGQGVSAVRLPASSWMAAANECDRIVDGRPQYRCGAEISVADEPLDVIEALRLGCNGRFILSGGTVKLLVGAPGAAVWSFTDEVVLVSDEQQLDPFPSLSETHNTITASYPDPDGRWTMKDAPEYSVESYVAADARWLTHPVPFRAVPFPEQVQALQRTIIEDGRRFRVHELPLPPVARLLEAGDVIAWTSQRNGYSDKLFIIEKIVRQRGSLQRATIREIDPSDYDPPEFVIPPTSGWLGRIEVPTQPMTGWSVEPATIFDTAGRARRPAIRISCASDQDDVAKVWVQVRLKDTGGVVFDSDANAYASPYSWLLSGGWMLDGEDYEARGRFVPYTSRSTEWSEWLSVTTPDLRLSYADLADDILAQLAVLLEWINSDLEGSVRANAQAIIDEAQAQAAALAAETEDRVAGAIEQADRFRSILSDLAGLRDYIAELDFSQFRKTEELRTSLTARIGSVVASFDERITVAASDTAALVIRTTALEASSGALSASIQQVEQASVSRDQALATQLSQISAGTDNQFDSARLWLFDQAVEGWSSNLGVAASGGFLRLGNGANPQALSPAGLGISANASRQVRARIRKTGNPTWVGTIWWRATSEAWDVSRRLTIAQPVFDVYGATNITGDMPWTGTVDQIRIDLSSAQSATDYFEIDWTSIGSPSPGASRAELAAEQSARASGDNANAQAITALQALLQSADGEIEALATGVSALTGDVQLLEDGLAAQAQALTAVETELADKASSTALATLEAEVEALGGGGIVSQGQAVTALRNEVGLLTAEIADQGFAAFLADTSVRNALTTASQTLTTRIDTTNGAVDVLAQAVTLVQAQLPGLASAQAVTALTTRVTAAEGTISATSQALTQAQAAIAGKAEGSALVALTTRVNEAEGDISSLSNAVLSVQSSLTDKADASALVSLYSSVDHLNQVASQQADALIQVSAGIGTMADGRFAMSAYSAGDGSFVRMAAAARLGSGDTWREAGWFIDLPTNGGPASMLVYANRFAFVDNGVVPFAIENGVTYLKDVNIERANIGRLTVGTSNIETGAVTAFNLGTTLVTLIHGPGSPTIRLDLKFTASKSTSGTAGGTYWIVVVDDGNVLFNHALILSDGGSTSEYQFHWYHPPADRASSTFEVRSNLPGSIALSNYSLSAVAFKR